MKNVKDIRLIIPKYPKLIIDTLKEAGFDAYIVGGCVRDALLLNVPSDFDITTNAKPEDVKKLFRRTIDTGIKHGTVTVLFYENDRSFTYEVTTYRVDGAYSDGRHPDNVKFVDNLKEDLLRRDFTINALAYNDDKGLIDCFGGLVDLEKKIVRAVGNPIERFTEDALRLLRAIRFAAKLSFDIEDITMAAIPKLAHNLSNVSKERVQVELTKTLISDNPSFVMKIWDLGLSPYIAKGFENIIPGYFEKNLKVHLAYACLFYHTNTLIISQILRELKFDNANISKIISLIEAKRYYQRLAEFDAKCDDENFSICVKELINELTYELTYDFIKLLSINELKSNLILKIKDYVDTFKSENVPITIQDLLINGNDIMECGFVGTEIGIVLSKLLKIVHKNRNYNTKNMLKELTIKAYNIYKGYDLEIV